VKRPVIGAVSVVQLHPVLPQLISDEPVVDEGGAPELRQNQPRHEQQLHPVPQRDPAEDDKGGSTQLVAAPFP
jgi:hypothetical protein